MEAYAISKSQMIKPAKARLTIDLIRGKSVEEAKSILNNTNTKASTLIMKTLNSAIANAVNNLNADETKLYINEAYINEGSVLKRYKPASKGGIDARFKRTSHIFIKVSDLS